MLDTIYAKLDKDDIKKEFVAKWQRNHDVTFVAAHSSVFSSALASHENTEANFALNGGASSSDADPNCWITAESGDKLAHFRSDEG